MANNQLLASDNFVSGSLAAGWVNVFGLSKCQVVAGSPNVVEANATSIQAGQIWTGLSWPKDQTSEVTATVTEENGTYLILHARWQTGAYSGYQVNIVNGTAQLFRYDTGVVGSTLSGAITVTIAPGDIWTLQVAGSVINLYQNYKRILYAADDTYLTGSPGFSLYTTVDITHVKVLSWAGYSAVQQDGIWQKQGIVIPIKASDVTSSGFGVFQPSAILYEGNAQILSGIVYKMWFTGGGLSTANIYYAESLDGVAWSRKAAAVISGQSNGTLIKVGATYYMYTQPAASQGSGNIALYTSTDGISWSVQSTTILSPGSSGAWDDTGFYVLCSPVIIGGTWYMLYTGSLGGSNGIFKMGLATSPNGLTWTKYGSNPVLSNAVAGAIAKVGSTFYIWVAAGPSSPFSNVGAFNYDPTDSVRYQSTDLIHWTNPTQSLHHSQIFESLNTPTGQYAPCSIIDIGGKAYMYSISGPGDSTPPQDYQIGLAIAPASIASIVTQAEDAVQQIASDSFTNGPGDLSPNWSTPTGGTKLKIVAGPSVEATVINTFCTQGYTGSSFSNDQYSEVTITNIAQFSYIFPAVRIQSGSNSWYHAQISGSLNTLAAYYVIQKVVNGAGTSIGPIVAVTPKIGDVFRLSVVGNVLSFFQNGHMILQVEDVNSTFTSGNPGVAIYAGTLENAKVSAWAGGNANVISFGTISGNAGIAGVIVDYTGSTSGNVTADGSGNYTLPVLGNGTYTITPSLAGVTFKPAVTVVTINNGNVPGINFVAVSSNNSLEVQNSIQMTNGLLVTNPLLVPNSLGGTADWS